MSENLMYADRVKNIPVMRFCAWDCCYCAFQKFQKISKCQECRDGVNHSHLEVLQRTPPKTKPGEFLTVGLSGDVSFMTKGDFLEVIDYCRKWQNRTFLIQSKNPDYFVEFEDNHNIPDNVIVGTTIETNRTVRIWGEGAIVNPHNDNYSQISKAPAPYLRTQAMVQLTCKKAVTIEPVLDFDISEMVYWMKRIAPEFVYVGYANDRHEGKKLKLPEPSLEKTMELIQILRDAGIEVREKTLRLAWWEK
jgi:uncharacterized Fe-S cluster-containing radical SAM superfamily protein